MAKVLSPFTAHERRPLRRARPADARVENQYPGDALLPHCLEVGRNANFGYGTIEPPPISPRLERLGGGPKESLERIRALRKRGPGILRRSARRSDDHAGSSQRGHERTPREPPGRPQHSKNIFHPDGCPDWFGPLSRDSDLPGAQKMLPFPLMSKAVAQIDTDRQRLTDRDSVEYRHCEVDLLRCIR